MGQALAALLGRAGRRVAVFERFTDIYRLPRAVHLDLGFQERWLVVHAEPRDMDALCHLPIACQWCDPERPTTHVQSGPRHHDLRLRTYVNDELRQDSNTGEMIYNCDQQVAHLSQAFRLEPGDVIATGTPAGIGAVRQPFPEGLLKVGDVVRVGIDGIGELRRGAGWLSRAGK